MSHDEFMGLHVAVVIMIHFLVVKLVELLHQIITLYRNPTSVGLNTTSEKCAWMDRVIP